MNSFYGIKEYRMKRENNLSIVLINIDTTFKTISHQSELSVVFFDISAYGTTQHLFLPVPVVAPSDWTCPRTFAFWQLILRVFTYIVSTALPLMAWLAKVGVAPTEPLSNTATKFALELDEIFAVFGTILNWNITASWTNQLFRFK